MPYLEKDYVISRPITSNGLQSELYAAMRAEDAGKSYLNNFCQIVRERGLCRFAGLERAEYAAG